jgi:hypothetical protein
MSGGTPFNAELFGAEHLMIEDDVASKDHRKRVQFGTQIKQFTVNDKQSCHAKNRQAITLEPFWRLSITLNDDPESMLILPPFEDALADKIILLKAAKKPMPMPTGSDAERAAFRKQINSELPAFLSFLLQWQIPPDLRSERFGIAHYHHPELLQAIEVLDPAVRLLELIDTCFWPQIDPEAPLKAKPPGEIVFSASKLESCLYQNDDVRDEAKKLLYWTNATGTYLGHLARKRADRVVPARTATDRRWLIKPPKSNDTVTASSPVPP